MLLEGQEKCIEIGCETAVISKLYSSLEDVLIGDQSESGRIYATKLGIRYEGNTMEWESVEKLFKALKEYSDA